MTNSTCSTGTIKPFLKWAGGKTQLLKELYDLKPKAFSQYIEPFVGGGAMFFYLTPQKSILSDSNEDLIITYKTIRDNVEDVISILKTYKNEESFYYSIRSLDPTNLTEIERAARLIFLNKTCFNGLYRVNKQGQFNVPFGKRKGLFLNSETLWECNKALQNVTIIHSDYKEVLLKYAKKNDFIFLDPPYYPVGRFSDFKRYTKEFFYHDDQVSLRNEFIRLVELGCNVLLTNSNHPVVLELYKDFPIKSITTKRLISSDPKTRSGTDIIVIGEIKK